MTPRAEGSSGSGSECSPLMRWAAYSRRALLTELEEAVGRVAASPLVR